MYRSVIVLLVLVACGNKESPDRPAPASLSATDARTAARAEFEMIARDYAIGTSKLYSRGDFFVREDVQKSIDEGDFIGRLRALFGAVPGDEYVLRHRATGLIVTAYAMQSGPSYGGGPRYEGALPSPGRGFADDSAAVAARVAADPVLAKGRPVDWSRVDLQALSPGELQALREKERAWMKRMLDARAPVGFPAVVTRLDALISAVPPVDWEVVRYWSDEPEVSKVGAKGGVSFARALPVAEGLEALLGEVEGTGPAIKDTASGLAGADETVVEYFAYHAARGEIVERMRTRVQAAWFRWAKEIAATTDDEMYKLSVEEALEAIDALGIDRAKAIDALKRP
jgi:hypothetical protein